MEDDELWALRRQESTWRTKAEFDTIHDSVIVATIPHDIVSSCKQELKNYYEGKGNDVENLRESYEQMALSAAEKLAKINKLPTLTEFTDGTVLFVGRKIGDRVYPYVFLLVADEPRGRRWYQTGRVTEALSDARLDSMLIRWELTEVSVVTEWNMLYGEAE
jgi:hypothetical protein